MNISEKLLDGYHFPAEFFGPPRQLAQDTLAVALFVIILSLIDVFFPLGEHRVNQPREFVGCSGDGLGLVHARAHAPEVSTQCRYWLLRRAAAAKRKD